MSESPDACLPRIVLMFLNPISDDRVDSSNLLARRSIMIVQSVRNHIWRWCVGSMLTILAACGGGAGPEASSAVAPSVARQVDAGKKADLKETLVAQLVSMVNTTTAGDQTLRAIGALSDGGYAVAWLSGTTLYMQRYDSAGDKVGTETPIQWMASPLDTVPSSSLAVLSDGSVVVAYVQTKNIQDPQGSSSVMSSVLSIRRFDADGVQVLPETQVASVALGDLNHPTTLQAMQILPMPGGGYLLGWTTVRLASGGRSTNSFSAQQFDIHNQRVGELTSISPSGISNAEFRILADGLGGYTVYWSGFASPFEWTGLMVTHYDVHRTATQLLTGWRGNALLVPLAHGRYVLYTNDTSAGVYRQFLDSAGAPVGEATQVEFMPVSAQLLADGTYVVFWTATSGGLTAQRYKPNGKAIGDVLMLQASGSPWLTTALQAGGFAVAWSAPGVGGDLDVYTRLFLEERAHNQRKACLNSAKIQDLKGHERKAFVDACMASASTGSTNVPE